MTKRTDAPEDRRALITPAELGEFLNFEPEKAVQQLAQMRYHGRGPRFVRVNAKSVRYRWADVEEWLQGRTLQRTDDRVAS